MSSARVRALFCFATLALVGMLTTLLLGASATNAQGPPGDPVSLEIAEPVQRSCFERELADSRGTSTITVPGPDLSDASFGTVEARLVGPPGADWDLAIFDDAGEVIAASTSSGAGEIASGYLPQPSELTIQACRISGEGTIGQLTVATDAVAHSEVEKVSLATVKTRTRAEKDILGRLGLDPSEAGGENSAGVVLYGSADREALERSGLEYGVTVPNLGAQSARHRTIEAKFAAETRASPLPSGRDTYRRLFDYTLEMKDLARENPDLVRPIALNHKTYEGRTVEGIEITTNPDNLRDGKPVYLQMGVHHAREWPAAEHPMEWAYELIKGYKRGDPRVTRLVEKTRTIVIPVINPDGFNASREAGQQQGAANGRDGSDIANFGTAGPNEYRRKNCRFADDSQGGSCLQPAFGVAAPGVDPNRNYGAFWAGPGASGAPTNETYYGPGPFSEPETQNVRELVSARQVTVLITNHTFSNLVLRPPGLSSEPDPIDEGVYKALGDAMAAQNGYLSQKGFELYDTSGTTEDWSYNTTGGLGFTFEIGCNGEEDPIDPSARCTGNFHPSFPKVIDEYEGTSSFAQAIGGKGNREAYFIAQEAAADPNRHSTLEGAAPPGAILKVEKTFETPTRAEDPAGFEDHLETEMKVPDSGAFDFHINPSTRPLVAQPRGRPAQGPPSGPINFDGAPDPAENRPCASAETTDPDCFTDHVFQIANGAGVDNDAATVEIEWASPASDWDMYVFRDGNADGDSLDPEDTLLGSSAQGTTNFESTTFIRPETADGRIEPGQYIARVVNYAAAEPYSGTVSFEGPEEFVPAKTETWQFSCTYNGDTRVREDILIARGERKTLNLSACGTGKAAKASCQGAKATLLGTKRNDRIVGTKKRDVIVALGGKDKIRSRGGNDLICAKGGNDKLNAGAGKDKVKAGGGRDTAIGGDGNDRIKGGGGADKLSGRGGKDRLDGGPGKDKLRGGGGKDRCKVRGKDKATGCEKT